MKHLFVFFLTIFSFMCFESCSDDKDNSGGESDDEYQLNEDSIHAQYVMRNLLAIDTLESGQVRCRVVGAKPLYDATPTVFYSPKTSSEDALQFFMDHCIPSDSEDKMVISGSTLTFSLGKYGSVSYIPSKTAGEYGTIHISLKEVPGVSSVVLIPTDLWPDNDFQLHDQGEILRDPNGNLWLVVSGDCTGGIAMNFSDDYQQWTIGYGKDWQCEGYANCPSESTWRCLSAMYFGDIEKYNALYDQWKGISALNNSYIHNENSFLGDDSPLTHLRNRTQRNYVVGNMTAKDYRWHARWYVHIYMAWVSIDPANQTNRFDYYSKTYNAGDYPRNYAGHCSQLLFYPGDLDNFTPIWSPSPL